MKAWYRVSFHAYASQNIARNESVIEKLKRSKKTRKRLPVQTVDVLSESQAEALHDAHNALIAGGGVSYVEILSGRPLKSELTEQQCRELLAVIDAERAKLIPEEVKNITLQIASGDTDISPEQEATIKDFVNSPTEEEYLEQLKTLRPIHNTPSKLERLTNTQQ